MDPMSIAANASAVWLARAWEVEVDPMSKAASASAVRLARACEAVICMLLMSWSASSVTPTQQCHSYQHGNKPQLLPGEAAGGRRNGCTHW